MGELPHPCSVCGKKFALAESLKKHMRAVHLKSRGYSCPYCDYAASRADMLKIHVRKIHTKDWSYTCQYCQASGTAFVYFFFVCFPALPLVSTVKNCKKAQSSDIYPYIVIIALLFLRYSYVQHIARFSISSLLIATLGHLSFL
jgi:hypothetical protein